MKHTYSMYMVAQYFALATMVGFFILPQPALAVDQFIVPSIGVQLVDGDCNKDFGPITYINDLATSGIPKVSSGWVSDGYSDEWKTEDPNCVQVHLKSLFSNTNMDFRFGIQLSDGKTDANHTSCSPSNHGVEKFTPWASEGGGWSDWAADGAADNYDCGRLLLETRPLPASKKVSDVRFGIQQVESKNNENGICTPSQPSGQPKFTPMISQGGGSSGWASDDNGKEPDCAKIYLGATLLDVSGTIIQKATINGVEQPVSFIEDYTQPNGSKFSNVTLNLPATFTNMPAGTWKVDRVASLDSSLSLTSITGCGNSLPCSATLAPGGTLEVTYNFSRASAPSGTIIVRTTKDGSDWDSPSFTVNYTGPGGTADATIDTDATGQQAFPGSLIGTYTVNGICLTCLPAGITFSGATPSSQVLVNGGTITFTFNFTTSVVPPPPVPTLTISPSSASVQVGGTQPFAAIYDSDGSGPLSPSTVTNISSWSSSNTSVAAVGNRKGEFAGVAAGSATITASYSGLTASALLTVTSVVATLDVTPSSWRMAVGETHQFHALYNGNVYVTDDPGTVWTSSNSSAVTVTKGLVTKIAPGTAIITATYQGLRDTADIIDPRSVLYIIPDAASLSFGETVRLLACFNPIGSRSSDCSGPRDSDVTASAMWVSNNSIIANVNDSSSKGLVTAGNTNGTTNIRARYTPVGGNTRLAAAAITVSGTVTPPPPDPELLVSCSASPTLTITGQPVVWTATATGGTGSYSSLWSGSSPLGGKTSNPVTLANGYSTPSIKTGSVQVTSGSQVVTQPCTTSVTVEPPPTPPTATLSASQEIIDKGNSSTLSWSSTNADSCTAIGGFNTGGATSGSVEVSPITTSDYQVSCAGPGGSANSNIATVTVVSVVASISASPSCITGGGSSRISWGATPASQVASCTVSGPGLSSSQVSGSQTVNVISKSTYAIACRTNGGSTVTKQVIVDTAGCWDEF